MTTRFLSNTPYARSEIEMQQIPGFRPRTSGISVSRFSYCARRYTQANNQREATAKELDTPSNCACHNCVLKAEKKNGSSPLDASAWVSALWQAVSLSVNCWR